MSDGIVPGFQYRSRAQELWALLIASFEGWEERVNAAAAESGLSPVSAWALVQLNPEEPISQKELAGRLHCNPSTVVDPTDRLEHAGLVVRRAHPADRRVNVLVVTPKGKEIRDALIERLFEPPEAFDKLPAKEQARFRDVLVEVVSGAQAHREKQRASGKRAP